MATEVESTPRVLSGLVTGGPGELVRSEILEPQFRYECEQLLPHYVAIEKVLAAEYERMGVLSTAESAAVRAALDEVDARAVTALGAANLTDIAFAVEQCVEDRLPVPVPRWHVDRSRNDLQSCAQLMFGLRQLQTTAAALLDCGRAAHRAAAATTDLPMPGVTHYQAAQISTPGHYLAAVSEQLLHTARRLLATHDGADACPLGAGPLAGQQLDWDRDAMARALGFARSQPLALTAVASRRWVLEITAELGILGAAVSRFCTDLLTWGSDAYGFLDLPDELCGISSAMPQKRNFPVLERIRGRSAHLSAFHVDAVLGQRNTPFTNLVEVSKEAGAHLFAAYETSRSALRLFTAVLGSLRFDARRMADACRREFFGGFTLANGLTLEDGVPWRRAQVIAGRYISEALRAGLAPDQVDAGLLDRVADEHGFTLRDAGSLLNRAFTPAGALELLVSTGSARPAAVRAVLADQAAEYARLSAEWARRAGAARPGVPPTPGGGAG